MGASLHCRVPSSWIVDPSLCLFEWQTLVGGGLALGAALIGAVFLYKQIKQSENFHRDELGRKHAAARAALPIALSSISHMVAQIVDNVAGVLESQDEPDFETAFQDFANPEKKKWVAPVFLEPDVVTAIQKFVETLDDTENVRHVAELISSIQILLARYNRGMKGIGSVEGLYGILLDSAKVSLLNDVMYNYGRFVEDAPFSLTSGKSNSETWDMIHGKTQSIVFHRRSPDFFFAKIAERIEHYKESDARPWLEKFPS